MKKKNLRKFTGNFMFASLNSLRGNNKSRRDDFESAVYVLLFLINKSTLPWSDFQEKFDDKKHSFIDLINERLKRKYSCQLMKQVPKDLFSIVRRTLCLSFSDEPPYDEMIRCLHLCFQKAIEASSPRCLPSISSHNRVDQLRNYVFEWNQTVGKRFLNRLLAS